MLPLSRITQLCRSMLLHEPWFLRHSFKLVQPKFNRLQPLSTVLEQPDQIKSFKPRRACLYTPGDDENKLMKSVSSKADCLIFDCEDGVASTRKV